MGGPGFFGGRWTDRLNGARSPFVRHSAAKGPAAPVKFLEQTAKPLDGGPRDGAVRRTLPKAPIDHPVSDFIRLAAHHGKEPP
jgi:hypothetical protein